MDKQDNASTSWSEMVLMVEISMGELTPCSLACSLVFFFSSRRRHTRCSRDWSSDVCSSDLRVVILTGAGEKSFVAGADINELAVQTPTSGREHALAGQHVFDLIENLGKQIGRASCRERV